MGIVKFSKEITISPPFSPSKIHPTNFLPLQNYPTSQAHHLGQYPNLSYPTKIFFTIQINFKVGIHIFHHSFGLQRNHHYYKDSTSTKIISANIWYPHHFSKNMGCHSSKISNSTHFKFGPDSIILIQTYF